MKSYYCLIAVILIGIWLVDSSNNDLECPFVVYYEKSTDSFTVKDKSPLENLPATPNSRVKCKDAGGLELTCGQIVIPKVCHGDDGCHHDIMDVTISDCIARDRDGEDVVKDGCKMVKWGDIRTKMAAQHYADFMGKTIGELVGNDDKKDIYICNDKAQSGSLQSNHWTLVMIIVLAVALIALVIYHFNIHTKVLEWRNGNNRNQHGLPLQVRQG